MSFTKNMFGCMLGIQCIFGGLRHGSAFMLQSQYVKQRTFSHLRSNSQVLFQMSPGVFEATMGQRVGPLKREVLSLDTDLNMEVLSQGPVMMPSGGTRRRILDREDDDDEKQKSMGLPPLIFVHGSFHGAWCWAEHWMPFFAAMGYPTTAISLRGTSGSPLPMVKESNQTKQKGDISSPPSGTVQISEHVEDIKAFLAQRFPYCVPCESTEKLKNKKDLLPPVLVGHSFGGMTLMKLMEIYPEINLYGAALLCSVPPSGNGPMTGRFIRKRFIAAIKIVIGFVFKRATKWPWLARQLFFSPDIDKKDLKRYVSYFEQDSHVTLDVRQLNSVVPSKSSDENGKSTFLDTAPPLFVLGAENDYIVDVEGLKETATFLDVQGEFLRGAYHDVMLGPQWKAGAERVLSWLGRLQKMQEAQIHHIR
uniref:AB hydrolase-1 domain-containing protein n=1 Tax=Fibrocapsa japonica TaxID=94617 RepID=A0A7S2UVZ8_9STRA|mmetsp:Transcript_1625/g.2242  ORF Transcript_1625/g.2242 Transcript_1625/m.2242 type:complete len:421 (+) Transcript_1625:61-1323(+)|eukprot:CAMPEP_0113950520 /NCGR_PEP_ID=MMETSP1339-20121228/81282_1 /TAXON_ID=94617 /ORGANISM="Fibrocapsa japonica" /LENGTH=420 /DNA_ID=CAMNT_0000958385 /DNA_START=50 /DNA_END=1312 /DNA_ORIENTATION=- /assembly_acc=CAM_ASM_000762